jgi:hypothetical protein
VTGTLGLGGGHWDCIGYNQWTPVTCVFVETHGAFYSLDLRQCLVRYFKTFQGNCVPKL